MIIQTLLVAFFVSYVGSIPPGTINISVMQLAIHHRRRAAFFFAIAASSVEFVYTGLAVQFQIFLNTNENISEYLKIITSVVLIILGLWNLFSTSTSKSVKYDKHPTGRHGFMRGFVLGVLNPMTIPFWLVITTYLENDGLVALDEYGFWFYLTGLSAGTFCLLLTVNALGNKFTKVADNRWMVHRLPGILLFVLGAYYLVKLLF